MNGQGRPDSELILVQPEVVSQGGEDDECYRVQRKTVASDTAISSSFAFMTGAMAAMALPPQIAVPNEISEPVFAGTFRALLIRAPRKIVVLMEINVSSKEFFSHLNDFDKIDAEAETDDSDLQERLADLCR